jgi:hypothetical protein
MLSVDGAIDGRNLSVRGGEAEEMKCCDRSWGTIDLGKVRLLLDEKKLTI